MSIWDTYPSNPVDYETPYELASRKERAGWITEYMEWRAAARNWPRPAGLEGELLALIHLYVNNGVSKFSELEWPDKIVLTAAYIGAFPEKYSDDLISDLGDEIDLLTEIANTMANIATEQMFSLPNEKTAVAFMHLITAAFVNTCAESLQEQIDEVIENQKCDFSD
jgi:hypothetical protein